MATPRRRDFTIRQGSSFTKSIRWEVLPWIWVPISSITKGAPARVTCSQAHGLPDGWRVAFSGVLGMTQINAVGVPVPRPTDFHEATVVSSTVLDLNGLDTSLYRTYASGGYVRAYTPRSLAGCVARMTIKNRVGGTTLMTLTSGNGRTSCNNTSKLIQLYIDEADTADIDWKTGVYDLEVDDGTDVHPLLYGSITVDKEVTT